MICDRFKCLPSEALRESADILRLIRIEQLGRREEVNPYDELG
jgi:hypothetical protein